MDSELNVTYIILDGYIDVEKYRALYFIVIFTVYVVIICSNSTIVCLIWIHKNLHEPMYIFIAALLLNSVLLSNAIYPKLLTDILSEKQVITYSTCLFQYFIFYTIGGAEFLLLTAMAYDRYVAICKPLQYPKIMKKSNVNILLVLAWLIPVCEFAIPTLINHDKELCNLVFKGIICNSTIYRLHCVRSNILNIYGLFVLANVVFFPVIFDCFTYTSIFIITYKRGRDVRKKTVQTCLPHLLVLLNLFCLSTYDVLLLRLEAEFPKIVRLIMSFQLIMYHPLFNPIIYGLKMKEISKHLKKLVCSDKRI